MTARSPRTLAALAAGFALSGTVVGLTPATGSAQAAEGCTASHLYVVKGRLEGAAGSRFLTVKLTNVGDDACSAGVATQAGFRDFNGRLGTNGAVSSGTGLVSLDPGETVKTVIHWTDPGPVPAAECQEAPATLVTLRVPSLRHKWRLPIDAQVCTTAQYKPDSEPLAAS
ncbi:MAG: DUF4232 domain-containing protein [Nocardioides sp.]